MTERADGRAQPEVAMVDDRQDAFPEAVAHVIRYMMVAGDVVLQGPGRGRGGADTGPRAGAAHGS